MLHKEHTFKEKITELREREKELRCLYRVEELIRRNLSTEEFLTKVVKVIPNGWQYPEICEARITYEGKVFKLPGWEETEWKQVADIEIDESIVGRIEVFYTRFKKLHVDSPFLPEEFKLLYSIATLVSRHIFSKKLLNTVELLKKKEQEQHELTTETLTSHSDMHWKWRYAMVQALGEKMDFDKFGIKGLYLIGSTKNATAGPASDIDLLIHMDEKRQQPELLKTWLEGWSLCLSEINFTRTGYKTDGLIDTHLITDEDIKARSSYAVMINSLENSAKAIKIQE